MTAFAELSALARAFCALWALFLCLTVIGSGVLSAVGKRLRCTVLALLLFAPVYYLWQIIFDLYLFGTTDEAAAVTRALCCLPWALWIAALGALTLAAALLLRYIIRYNRTYITPGTIKLFLDGMPCGVCCWNDSGRVLFSNICMNRLCAALTDSPLLNGSQFRDAVGEGILTVDGRVWRFVSRTIDADGELLHEMIASDITAEYAETEALKSDREALARLNRELEEYYLSIDETVPRQEILQAKMNIHDEMNRLMLSTVAADKEDTRALDHIFSLWEQNALLLCMEADRKTSRYRRDAVDALAQALGVRLIWHGELPSALGEKERELVFLTAQEAIANAVKHAGARTLEISFDRSEEELTCTFVNDGTVPTGEVRFTGGLMNLSRLAATRGAALTVKTGETFALSLIFPQKAEKT